MLGQAQQMSGKMEAIKEELRKERVTGNAGGGLVTIEMNGTGDVLSVKLDAKLVERNELEMLEDLIPAAVNSAIQKAKELHARKLHSLAGEINLPIPGIQEAIAKLSGADFLDFDDEDRPQGT